LNDSQNKVLELLDSSGEALHRLLGRLTLCEHTTGDLIQELFIRLCNSEGFANARDPVAYAWRTAVNLAFEWRRKQRIKFEPLDEDYLPAHNSPSALKTMIRSEELQQVLDAVSQLPELSRNVVVLRFIEEQPYEAIAGQLGKNPHYLRSLCAKAIARVRTLLNDQDDIDVKDR
jgi:RNA polymerase sigma-70 factor (ECF subfamily)